MSDQLFHTPSTTLTVDSMPVVKIHPSSVLAMRSHASSVTTVTNSPGHPLFVSVDKMHVPDTNTDMDHYVFNGNVRFLYDAHVADTWSALVDFRHMHGSTNLNERIRLQELSLFSTLPIAMPSQYYVLACYRMRHFVDPKTYVLDTTTLTPDLFLPITSNVSDTIVNMHQEVIKADPLGASITLTPTQWIFALGGPYYLCELTPGPLGTALALLPGNSDPIADPVYGAVMQLRYVAQRKSGVASSQRANKMKHPLVD